MFTGIVKGKFPVVQVEKQLNLHRIGVDLGEYGRDLKIGASVAVNGTCLTVVKVEGSKVYFDVIKETLDKTNLGFLKESCYVNVERSARFGDEIGGHLLSGHVQTTGEVVSLIREDNVVILTCRIAPELIKYIFPKGYIALDGASLTLVDVRPNGEFSVHLIPETLRIITIGDKSEGDKINIELDAWTQAIVDTVERMLNR